MSLDLYKPLILQILSHPSTMRTDEILCQINASDLPRLNRDTLYSLLSAMEKTGLLIGEAARDLAGQWRISPSAELDIVCPTAKERDALLTAQKLAMSPVCLHQKIVDGK